MTDTIEIAPVVTDEDDGTTHTVRRVEKTLSGSTFELARHHPTNGVTILLTAVVYKPRARSWGMDDTPDVFERSQIVITNPNGIYFDHRDVKAMSKLMTTAAGEAKSFDSALELKYHRAASTRRALREELPSNVGVHPDRLVWR